MDRAVGDEHDWNRCEPDPWEGIHPRVIDETLRDGLQSASAFDPPLDRKIAMLHAMVGIGVDAISVGLPAAGPRAVRDATELAREIRAARLPIRATAAARTVEGDVSAIAEVSSRAGISTCKGGNSALSQLMEAPCSTAFSAFSPTTSE